MSTIVAFLLSLMALEHDLQQEYSQDIVNLLTLTGINFSVLLIASAFISWVVFMLYRRMKLKAHALLFGLGNGILSFILAVALVFWPY